MIAPSAIRHARCFADRSIAVAVIRRAHLVFATAVLIMLGCNEVRATSVQPPTFSELVDGSALVFRGQVTASHCEWRGDAVHRHPATLVTFSIERVLKGTAGATVTLEFIGGTVGGHTLEIAGLPRFAVGERGVFFVENEGGHLCPLMRLRYGQYDVVKDATNGAERVVRANGQPLRSTTTVQSALSDVGPSGSGPSDAGALDLTAFENAITGRVEGGTPHSTLPR